MESIIQGTSVQEPVRLEVSPVTPKTNRFCGYSSTSSPFNGPYSSENTPIQSPRRRRRRDPIPFNVLILGFLGSGKTSFTEFLYEQLNVDKENKNMSLEKSENPEDLLVHGFKKYYANTEVNGEKIGVTLWDSRGLGVSRDGEIVDLQMDEVVMFVESKFEDTFSEETKVKRSHKHIDTQIHCVLYLMDPTSPYFHDERGVDAVDISIIQRLSRYTTVIPVISKVDTCTKYRVEHIKQTLRKGMENNGIKFLEFLRNDESNDEGSMVESGCIHDNYDEIYDILPFGCMTPECSQMNPVSARTGTASSNLYREYPWGVADPLNNKHCDFLKLKEMVFGEWRNEMRDFCKEVLYENWRTDRLQKLGDLSLKMTKTGI